MDVTGLLQAWCGPGSPLGAWADRAGDGGLPLILLAVGLVGSVGHCVGMCGPFVLTQVGSALLQTPAQTTVLQRLGQGALLPYHLGRATTYMALGAAAAGLANAVVSLSGWRWPLALLLLLAAGLLLAQGASALMGTRATAARVGWLDPVASFLARAAAPLTANPRGPNGYALGVALGFLPCGLLYGALAAAAGTGSATQGALAMGAFALGTMPSLIGVGQAGAFFGRRWIPAARTLLAPLMIVNAGFLGVLAVRAVL